MRQLAYNSSELKNHKTTTKWKKSMSYSPEDLLPDDKNHVEMNGTKIRKGTMGAALANAKIIESSDATTEEKQAALIALKQLAPALIAFGLTTFLQWKNPIIQNIFDQVEK